MNDQKRGREALARLGGPILCRCGADLSNQWFANKETGRLETPRTCFDCLGADMRGLTEELVTHRDRQRRKMRDGWKMDRKFRQMRR